LSTHDGISPSLSPDTFSPDSRRLGSHKNLVSLRTVQCLAFNQRRGNRRDLMDMLGHDSCGVNPRQIDQRRSVAADKPGKKLADFLSLLAFIRNSCGTFVRLLIRTTW
jgi:hypothetical protein